MKAVKIIHEEILQKLDCQERRIIAYVAAKKNQTGNFPKRHKQTSKRLRAFHSLIAKGIISISGTDNKSIKFRLNPCYSEQKFHRFYTSTGLYVSKNAKPKAKSVHWFENIVKRMQGILTLKQKVQQVSAT